MRLCSARLTDELVKAYDLQKEVTVCARGTAALPLLPPQGACRFHTDSYVRFLQQISHNGIDIVDEAAHYALNSSVCFSETAWEYSQIYAGASVEGAGSVARGEADVAGGIDRARYPEPLGLAPILDLPARCLRCAKTRICGDETGMLKLLSSTVSVNWYVQAAVFNWYV